MDGTRDSHTEWSKSERERQIPYDITYIWNLIYDTNESFHIKESFNYYSLITTLYYFHFLTSFFQCIFFLKNVSHLSIKIYTSNHPKNRAIFQNDHLTVSKELRIQNIKTKRNNYFLLDNSITPYFTHFSDGNKKETQEYPETRNCCMY